MKLNLIKDNKLEDDYIVIKYRNMNDKIRKIIEITEECYPYIICEDERSKYQIDLNDVYYFESVDKTVYLYTNTKVYSYSNNLKDLEEILNNIYFIRISKSMIVNLHKVKEIKADVNMKLLVYLTNNEKVIITRHYRDNFYNAIKKISIV